MKRTFGFLPALVLALALFGCGEKAPAVPQPGTEGTTIAAPGAQNAPTGNNEISGADNASELTWRYELTTREKREEYTNDAGVLLATTNYAIPELGLICDGNADGQEAPREMSRICAAFNAEAAELEKSLPTAGQLAELAQIQYDETDPEYRENFFAYYEDVSVMSSRTNGDLLELLLFHSGYWGGAHGGATIRARHFDLAEGTFFKLNDLTDRPDELMRTIGTEIVTQIYDRDEADWYFPDFDETIQQKNEYKASFDESGMTVYFDEYEIAPYASGLPEFEIPYAKISRFLNERGRRLLALPPETTALGDYYDAEELWYWFEGAAPVNYEDHRETDDGGYYCRFTGRGISTLEDLRALLCTRFSDELADERLAGGLFREFDGVLYAMAAGRGTDMTIESVDCAAELDAGGNGGRILVNIHRRDFDDAKSEWYSTGETNQVEIPFELTETGARFAWFPTIW